MAEPGDRGRDVPLQVWGSGTQPSNARRRGDVVSYREAGPWSTTVLTLLRHLEEAGFAGVPRVAGSGFAAAGREMLSYVPGASPQPHMRGARMRSRRGGGAAAGAGCLGGNVHPAAWRLLEAVVRAGAVLLRGS